MLLVGLLSNLRLEGYVFYASGFEWPDMHDAYSYRSLTNTEEGAVGDSRGVTVVAGPVTNLRRSGAHVGFPSVWIYTVLELRPKLIERTLIWQYTVCFVASDVLTTICHLAIVNICVIIIFSIGNTQISILLLCFLYLFAEFMITMNE